MKNYTKGELNRLVKQLVLEMMDQCEKTESLPEPAFQIIADSSAWPECLRKMREGKDMTTILQETNVIDLLYILKKLDNNEVPKCP